MRRSIDVKADHAQQPKTKAMPETATTKEIGAAADWDGREVCLHR